MMEILQISNQLHSVLGDKYAVERRCVPPREVLNNVFVLLIKTKGHLVIGNLEQSDLDLFFRLAVRVHNYKHNSSFPNENQLRKIEKTFKYVIAQNNRLNAELDVDDLWVLYLLYNVVQTEENRSAYLDKFKAWGM